jgi:hypothetical protein
MNPFLDPGRALRDHCGGEHPPNGTSHHSTRLASYLTMQIPSAPENASEIRASWYDATIEDFFLTPDTNVLGRLVENSGFSILPTQKDAWLFQVEILKNQLKDLKGWLFLEFNIPRMGRRIDAVVISGPVCFVIEFKVGSREFDRSAVDQVWDYALDLKNFHEASHRIPIVPLLVSTGVVASTVSVRPDSDGTYRPILSDSTSIRHIIDQILGSIDGPRIDAEKWSDAPYRPTPTIIEAARALYANHSVQAIARYDAGAQNLSVTSRRIEEIVEQAERLKQKTICFVTGVPGAGKTLVGLNVATARRKEATSAPAVFLSGNGPLVAVLREALTRDEFSRQKAQKKKVRKGAVAGSVKAFIQNVHHFRDASLVDSRPPADHIVIFDEAQRAWNLRQTANFMQRKKKRQGFNQSEPEFLISCMDRHEDWAVIVCLVGGGQEINTGEAGIDAWIEAVNAQFPEWQMYISSKLTDTEYGAGKSLDAVISRTRTTFDDSLHLAVSMRSFRAENVSSFVKALLECEEEKAKGIFSELADRYPVFVTRDLAVAKKWMREKARGTERCGLVASSRAQRLKPHAIDIRVDVNPVHWFLNEKEDTRSSYYLEDAATEFQVQGLELDWVCVSWDGDLRFTGTGWSYHDFRGSRWCNVANTDNRNYLRNAYRVLLTRARQGMVIFVPPGDVKDPTRTPKYYDPVFEYFRKLGIPTL